MSPHTKEYPSSDQAVLVPQLPTQVLSKHRMHIHVNPMAKHESFGTTEND